MLDPFNTWYAMTNTAQVLLLKSRAPFVFVSLILPVPFTLHWPGFLPVWEALPITIIHCALWLVVTFVGWTFAAWIHTPALPPLSWVTLDDFCASISSSVK